MHRDMNLHGGHCAVMRAPAPLPRPDTLQAQHPQDRWHVLAWLKLALLPPLDWTIILQGMYCADQGLRRP